jgi:transcriptional regulator with XRE-family HTH domain
MKINVDVLLQLRKARSWSQDELAIASGLNLRTIQRIEKEASASLQSKKALASAFDIDVHDLEYEELSMLQELKGKTVSIAMGTTDFSYVLKGKVLEIKDSWLKLRTKKSVEYIRVDAIVRILAQ